MKIELRSQHIQLNQDMTDRIISRVRFVLSRFGGEISRVQVRFADANGPKGGLDNHCLLSVKLSSSGKIVANGTGVDLLSALHYCVERAERAIIRELERRRDTPIRMNRRRQKRKNEHIDEQSEYPVDN
ncbi:MAG: HPF/RaiA family ribosome-associated protein [Proteobacteria bacterium]|nr:HPF/RaiA family ribosome-associated protein [Pseudomonadota bacterium]